MAELTREDRIALARDYHARGSIIQNSWHSTASDGRDLVCALAAFGEPGEISGTEDCPADLMPGWLAHLVPALDDGIAASEVTWFSGALIDRAAQWHRLDDAGWERIRTGVLIAGVRRAIEAATEVQQGEPPEYWSQVTAACDQVCTALQTGVGLPEARAAARAAEAAAWAAARAAWAAEAAAWAAEAAAWAAEAAARAARAAWAARAAEAAAYKALAETLFALIDVELAALPKGADHV